MGELLLHEISSTMNVPKDHTLPSCAFYPFVVRMHCLLGDLVEESGRGDEVRGLMETMDFINSST